MKRVLNVVAVVAIACASHSTSQSQAILGPVSTGFGVLAGSTVTNTGATVVTGNVGVSPGSAITGFPPGTIVSGVQHINDAVAVTAQNETTTAYNTIANEAFNTDLSGQNLGGMTLLAGVYHFSSSAQLTGILTLNALGNSNARFDFQIGSTLTSASNAQVNIMNGGTGNTVYWQVGSSATLGTNTQYLGTVMVLTSITMNTGSSDTCGRMLARNGAVTLDTNAIGPCSASASTPEPGIVGMMLGSGVGGLLFLRKRIKRN